MFKLVIVSKQIDFCGQNLFLKFKISKRNPSKTNLKQNILPHIMVLVYQSLLWKIHYVKLLLNWAMAHTSKMNDLCSSYCLNSKEMLQNHLCFFISIIFLFYLMNVLIYVDIDQDIHKVKIQKCLEMKNKKLCGFSYSMNMANFEPFRWVFSS